MMDKTCFNCVKSDSCIHTWECYDNPNEFECEYGFEPKKKIKNNENKDDK